MFVSKFWDGVTKDVLTQAGFLNHPRLIGLIPDCSWFDTATSFGSINYPTNILDFVRNGQVKVLREDIDHLQYHAVCLKNGTSLHTDAFIASSGWKWEPTVKFKPASLHASLGVASSEYTEGQKSFWADLDARADKDIFSRFPMLRTRPTLSNPPSQVSASTPSSTKTQPSIPSEIWARRKRYTYGFGKRFVDFVWDAVPWNDVLLKDLGLEGARKRSGWFFTRWWREAFEPYTVADYRGIGEEWLAKQEGKEKKA
ncbi:hypothetical protein Slin14017_G081390 [Septoria linicola]|nr:hypothetical protein Slin14017_G081390 [Septoria linicola]